MIGTGGMPAAAAPAWAAWEPAARASAARASGGMGTGGAGMGGMGVGGAIVDNAQYNFEASAQGWAAQGPWTGAARLTTQHFAGAASLGATLTYTPAAERRRPRSSGSRPAAGTGPVAGKRGHVPRLPAGQRRRRRRVGATLRSGRRAAQAFTGAFTAGGHAHLRRLDHDHPAAARQRRRRRSPSWRCRSSPAAPSPSPAPSMSIRSAGESRGRAAGERGVRAIALGLALLLALGARGARAAGEIDPLQLTDLGQKALQALRRSRLQRAPRRRWSRRWPRPRPAVSTSRRSPRASTSISALVLAAGLQRPDEATRAVQARGQDRSDDHAARRPVQSRGRRAVRGARAPRRRPADAATAEAAANDSTTPAEAREPRASRTAPTATPTPAPTRGTPARAADAETPRRASPTPTTSDEDVAGRGGASERRPVLRRAGTGRGRRHRGGPHRHEGGHAQHRAGRLRDVGARPRHLTAGYFWSPALAVRARGAAAAGVGLDAAL